MATATVMVTNSGLKAEYDKVSSQALAAGRKCEDLQVQKRALEAEVQAATARYEGACRSHAADDDKAADPATALAEADRLRHKLRGIDSLIATANAEHAPLAVRLQTLGEQMVRAQEDDQVDELVAKQANLRTHLVEMQAKLRAADKDLLDVTHQLSALRGRIANRRK